MENNVVDVYLEHTEENDDIKVVLVHVNLSNVKIVDVEDDNSYNRTSDNKREENDDNIPGMIAGSFVCNICNVVTKSKHELVSHKVSQHNWCIKCFSTFDSRENLKNHLSTKHKKK